MTPSYEARALYENMHISELLEMRAAFEADLYTTCSMQTLAFANGRLALIADVLEAREDAARKADA
jgi:hypothetical protein